MVSLRDGDSSAGVGRIFRNSTLYTLHFTLTLALALTLAAATTATAGVDMFVTFHTKGPDKYADGTGVLERERYALVWSADGVFDGITATGAPVDPDDRVVIVAGVAHEGHCPHVLYQLPAATAEKLAGGVYDVILLDTRLGGAVADSESALPGIVNGWTRTTAGVKFSDSQSAAMEEDGVGHVVLGGVAAPPEVEQPKVLSMKIDGDCVLLQVENLKGHMRVNGGPSADSRGALTGAVASDGGNEPVTLVAPKTGHSGFYRVIRD